MKVITQEQIDEILRLYNEERLSQKNVAKKIGLAQSTICKILKDANVPTDKSSRLQKIFFSPEQYADMKAMYESGEKMQVICDKYGFTCVESLRRHLLIAGVTEWRTKIMKDAKQNKFETKDQLCWECAKAVGKCSWTDKSFTPVPGWTATEVLRQNHPDTYHITACPEFERG